MASRAAGSAGQGQVDLGYVPTDPPIASLITVDAADAQGYATIDGAAGATTPGWAVYIAGIDTGLITGTLSLDDGSFGVGRFYAPPGAWILVKQGPDLRDPIIDGDEADVAWLNALPGTIVRAPLVHTVSQGALPLAAAGSAELGRSHWMLHGEMISQTVGLDRPLSVTGTLRVSSLGITSSTTTTDGQVLAFLRLRRLFDAGGQQVPVNGVFASTFHTPTGLPISREPQAVSPVEGTVTLTGWHYASEHVMAATLSGTLPIPPTLQPGYYRPFLRMAFSGIPPGPDQRWSRLGINNSPDGAYLPVIQVGDPAPARLIWTLLSNTLSDATRGTVALQDKDRFGLSPHIITQADVFIVPRVDARTGEPILYRLEPFLPLVSMGDRSVPGPPLIPFALPSGALEVMVERPGGGVDLLGLAPFQQSAQHGPTNRQGKILDEGGGRIDDMYQLSTLDDAFAYTFGEYGHHIVTLDGAVEDIWGNVYQGHGTYEVHVARPLKLDPGQLPTTPYEVGDAFSPGLQVYPPVPAAVTIRLRHLPYSNPDQEIVREIGGQANRFGYFQPPAGTAITMTIPGEFRVDIVASYVDQDGTLWMGSATWGNVVERPGTPLVAHGRRGLDNGGPHNLQWFFHRDLGVDAEGLHSMYPYWSGDVLWGSEVDERVGGYAIIPAVTVQDTGGPIQSIIEERWHTKAHSALYEGLGFAERIANQELPLFSTTSEGADLLWSPEGVEQLGYAYRSSERPGVQVHETISEDALGISYWRFDAEFGGQAGFLGDLPNDLKWEFGGAVFRVLTGTTPIDEYAIYGSLWVLLPDNDPDGSRVTPPFRGATGAVDGGPIMTLRGEPVDLFFLPKGVQPGDILALGDTFSFAGHVGPPLDSSVMVTVTSPSGDVRYFEGLASKVGWFYDPSHDFVVEEPGVWTVQVHVVHDTAIPSGGAPTTNNTGGVLGASDGRYAFYAADGDALAPALLAPQPGFLPFPTDPYTGETITVTQVSVTGIVPPVLEHAVVSYTIRMPGFILEQGTVEPLGNVFSIAYDPLTLHEDFPNLDLVAKDAAMPGLADPVLISYLVSGWQGQEETHYAGAMFINGEEVQAPGAVYGGLAYLPLVER
jgi:hypothetical protein